MVEVCENKCGVTSYLSTSCGRENGGWFVGRDLVRGVWIKVARGMHLGRWGLGEVGEEDGVMEQGRRQ